MSAFELNVSRMEYDLRDRGRKRYDAYWEGNHRPVFPPALFDSDVPVWLEIGAGSGWFFVSLAELHPSHRLLAVERCRMRAKRLVRRAKRSGLPNLFAFRGNAIPAVIHQIPERRLDRIYILYPCPWVRMSQRKNRWYLHPMMPHLVRCLRPGGHLIWASDQRFYIEEAKYVSERHYGLTTRACGELKPNPYNSLDLFPQGRTKFEHSFLSSGVPCYELVSEAPIHQSDAPRG